MAITFKAVVVPGNRRQDGTYNVKIRVTSGGQYRRGQGKPCGSTGSEHGAIADG